LSILSEIPITKKVNYNCPKCGIIIFEVLDIPDMEDVSIIEHLEHDISELLKK